MTDINNDTTAKPVVGTVAPATVAPIYQHTTVILTGAAAAIPTILLIMVQLQQMPGLPTNVLAYITAGISILTFVGTLLSKLGYLGASKITPTAAAKVIQSTPRNGDA